MLPPASPCLGPRFALPAFLLVAILCFAAGFGARAMEAPAWDHPALRVAGEPIMATHDAYAWLAGARGTGASAGTPFAGLLSAASSATGLSLGQAAFWLPAVLGGLAAVAVALWGWTLAGGALSLRAAAALCAGLAGALAPGFYLRTRLGWYDTDLVTLLFPLLVAWTLAAWLSPWLRPASSARADPAARPGHPGLVWPLLAGVLARGATMGWHASLRDFVVVVLILALVLALALGRRGHRARLTWGLALFALAGFGGLPGLAMGLVAAGLDVLAPRWSGPLFGRMIPALIVVAALLAGTGLAQGLARHVLIGYRVYSKPAVTHLAGDVDAAKDGPVYPGVVQSVREAQNLRPLELLDNMSAAWWLSALGLAGFCAACLRRPALLLLAPLGVLALASIVLGARTSMFGGPVVALGLALPLCWLARRGLARIGLEGRPLGVAALLVLAAAVGGGQVEALARGYRPLQPAPVITRQHALALRALGRTAPADAMVWTWWDYGYAAQYYSGLRVFADGARHDGRRLFPLGVAMASASPLQSAQMMGYCVLKNGRPWEVWDRLGAAKVRAFVQSMASRRYDLSGAPPSYLVVCWENMPLLPWITHFGSWDVVRGQGLGGAVEKPPRGFGLSLPSGELQMNQGEALPLADMLTLDVTSRRLETFRPKGPHLVVNKVLDQALVLDDRCNGSMLYRLLVAAPDDPELAGSFRLVYEGAPLVRVYEVLYPGQDP